MFSPICRRYATIAFISLLIGASGGGVLSMVFGARKGALWTEPPPWHTSRLQGTNFADMAEQSKACSPAWMVLCRDARPASVIS